MFPNNMSAKPVILQIGLRTLTCLVKQLYLVLFHTRGFCQFCKSRIRPAIENSCYVWGLFLILLNSLLGAIQTDYIPLIEKPELNDSISHLSRRCKVGYQEIANLVPLLLGAHSKSSPFHGLFRK